MKCRRNDIDPIVLKRLLENLISEHEYLAQKGDYKEAALVDREIKRLRKRIGA